MINAKEGDLYGRIDAFGKVFEIYYGYYEEFERDSKYNDPVPVYPDLAAKPEYSGEGFPIVTQMQVACESYKGKNGEDQCGMCEHFQKGDKLFGLCRCEARRKKAQS